MLNAPKDRSCLMLIFLRKYVPTMKVREYSGKSTKNTECAFCVNVFAKRKLVEFVISPIKKRKICFFSQFITCWRLNEWFYVKFSLRRNVFVLLCLSKFKLNKYTFIAKTLSHTFVCIDNKIYR